ncbi:MAG TPA: bacillithiol biosynthesis cysteine-adding enzyme BshC [Longimicrobiales bacterium]
MSGSTFVQEYQQGLPAAMAFFRGSPRDVSTYRSKAEEVAGRFDADRRREAASLIRATTPAAASRLEEVIGGGGVFVTTGQQPGLFTGPLYTIYKILHAVRLAAALEPVLERPVAPLFWIASDDHDWEEANHVHVLDRENVLHRVTLADAPDAPPASMRNRVLGPSVEATLDEFIQHLPTTEFADGFVELLRSAYRPGRTVAEAFTDVIAGVCAPFDLLLVDGGQPRLKALAAETVERELERSAAHEELLAAQARRLEEHGYAVQVPVLEGATNVFYEDDQGRERIFRDPERPAGFVLRRTGRRFDADALRALLAAEPERFSANVVLRPVVENVVLPTVAYVGGPGEVAYLGQLKPLFEAHGIGMPVVVPRSSVTVIERKIAKVLERFDLDVDAFRRPAHEVAARVLREELPESVTSAVAALREALAGGYDRLMRAAREIDPTLKGPLEGARNASQVQLSEVEKKIAHHLKLRNDVGIEQLDKARANLFPDGNPQERVLNIFQYLVRYGPELLAEIAGRMDVRLGAEAAGVR